ncbi:hypothetical protein Ah1_00113 [Aeromonas phage Ah1]|uniref:Uncharacterized protein n=1 Tax=Aeromonas phage Ah1 TaxID=2053701 RepID=A0A2H4YF96_9CAUD|nr:hypothetical protein KNT77_gp113 [Aeromonas phage Ah1]AUE22654.1 hypothetical protein Ah1_00113 [Aeromonas phage Ah1]
MKKSFMEIVVESLVKEGKNFCGSYVAQDKDGSLNFFLERPKRKVKTHFWDTKLGSVDSVAGVELHVSWHKNVISLDSYKQYIAYRFGL